MKLMKLVAVAALAIAVTAPLAAQAAPGSGTQIAEERTAPTPLVDLVPAYAVQPAGVPIAGGGKQDLVSAAQLPAPAPSVPLVAARATWVSADREAVAWHPRL